MAITSISQTRILSVRSPLLDSNGSVLRTVDASGVTWGILGTVGAQWDITDRLVAGMSLRTPTAKILSTGSLSYQSTAIQGTTSSQSYFRDSNASFSYKLPLDLNFGLAWREKRFDVEVDVRFHSGISPYTMLGSEEGVTNVATDASGAITTTTTPFPGITYGAHQVWNVALGGRYSLDESWSLHGGFYSDLAPADEDTGTIFRTVNLYGLTTGAKLKGTNLSGSLGIGLGWGKSAEFSLGDYGGEPGADAPVDLQRLPALRDQLPLLTAPGRGARGPGARDPRAAQREATGADASPAPAFAARSSTLLRTRQSIATGTSVFEVAWYPGARTSTV